MRPLALSAVLPLIWAAPAAAQSMQNMPGMNMPGMSHAAPAAKLKKKALAPAAAPDEHGAAAAAAQPASPPLAGGPAMPGMDMSSHAGHVMAPALPPGGEGATAPAAAPAQGPGMAGMAMPAPAEPAIPDTPPPAAAKDHLADRYYDPAAMAASRHMMRMEMGGTSFSKVMINLGEYQTGAKGDGYRWDGQAWFGGDLNRFVLRSEGEGSVKDGLDSGEVQALYSRAVGRYADLQTGVRQDFAPVGRTYLTIGAQSLFPFWFDLEGALFLSTKGELLARAEGTYDFRLTQRLVLQPRAELNFAAQDTRETRTGSGLSNAELGLRLRYEIRREFAPYIGVSYDRRLGRTADYVRAAGEDPKSTTFVVGIRTWF
jgi:copper resistance protein B